ncbi:putative MFS transporter [Filobasidium floriforme]|uniref:putative MFS transporter n=1 Tax=Filobasidium floriforme TaxID=5210 RepID=UPI001E8EB560|nr:putative MFS transporter [Filobasidium floriforme]KAH8087430.1 putative MFS transporter [Filobasidium floriforme]
MQSASSAPLSSSGRTPLPVAQLAVLMIVRLAEPISYTSLFPYINQQVGELGIAENEDRVGYYSGVVEAVFAGVQVFTVYNWATLSDKIGRKPVIMLGLMGVAISSALYGFSTKYWQLIVTRSLSGALNGNVAVVRAAVSEITDESNAPDAFALYGLVWILGSVFGNAIGGYLSHPVERYPHLFAVGGKLEEHPYLLPCLVTTGITLAGLLFTALFMRETHAGLLYRQSKSDNRPSAATYKPVESDETKLDSMNGDAQDDDDDTRTLVGDPDSPTLKSPRSFSDILDGFDKPGEEVDDWDPDDQVHWGLKELLSVKSIQRMLLSLFLLSFIGGGWAALILLYAYTPTRSGGLGMTPSAIGTALSIQGLWSVVCQLTFLSKMQRKYGTVLAFQRLNAGWVLVFLTLPLVRVVAVFSEGQHAGENGESRSWLMWIALMAWLALSTFIGMSHSVSMVVVQLACPDKRAIAGLNGVSTCVQCLSRVIGPWLVSSVFALSIDQKVLNGNLWWIFMAVISIISAFVSLLLEDKSRSGTTFEMGSRVSTA